MLSKIISFLPDFYHGRDAVSTSSINKSYQEWRTFQNAILGQRQAGGIPGRMLVLRHGLSQSNEPGSIAELLPPNELVRLTPLGIKQSDEAGSRFNQYKRSGIIPADYDPKVIIYSGLQRTEETLFHFLTNSRLDLQKPRIFEQRLELDEVDWGWEDRLSLKNLPPDLIKAVRDHARFYRSHLGGETPRDHQLRIRQFFRVIKQKYRDQDLLIVAHHKTIKQILSGIFMRHHEQYEGIDRSLKVMNAGMVFFNNRNNYWNLDFWEGKEIADYFMTNAFPYITFEQLKNKYE